MNIVFQESVIYFHPKIQQKNHEWLYGINAVEAAVSSSHRKHFAMWVKHPVGERIQRLQKAAEERERNERRQISARRKARRGGGKRLLMTAARFENMGSDQNQVGTQKTLGADRNPRDS